jgi:hypothetical protein
MRNSPYGLRKEKAEFEPRLIFARPSRARRIATNIAKLPELLAAKRATRRVTYYDPLRERRGSLHRRIWCGLLCLLLIAGCQPTRCSPGANADLARATALK